MPVLIRLKYIPIYKEHVYSNIIIKMPEKFKRVIEEMESEDDEYSNSNPEQSTFVQAYSHEKLRLYELNEEN